MFKQSTLSLFFLTAFLAIATAGHFGSGEASGRKAVHAEIQPRLLLWNRRNDNSPQQPIVIVTPNQGGDSDRRRPQWPDFYPYPQYPSYPSFPQRPPFQYPGLNDYLNGSAGSIVIINPNNAQNLSFPAAAAATTTAGGRSGGNRRNSIPLIDLLQGLNAQEEDADVITALDNESEAAAAAQAPLAQYGGGEERDEEMAEDELALLERQAARGLSTKHLLSFLLQDKRRRRFQEAVAGIYLRNYNQK